MRKTLTALALCSSIWLAGCASIPGMPPSLPIPTSPVADQAVVLQVQTIAKQICSYVPTGETILSIIGTFTTIPFAGLATTAADAICAAVNKAGVNRSGKRTIPRVNGVAVRGRFER